MTRKQGGYRPFGTQVKARPATDTRAKCWTAMRVLLRFDVAQLMVTAEAKRNNAQDYTQRLAAAGFLRMVVPGRGGAKPVFAVFQLMRNSGPRAPITRKTGTVYDPNTDTCYAPGGAVVVADNKKKKGTRDGQGRT